MLSIAKGPTDEPLLDLTLGQAVSRAADLWGDRLALVSRHQGLRWTWDELRREIDRAACGLLRLGVRKGDRVGIWAPNCAEWTVIQFATARIGAILVNINPAYRAAEVEYALNKVGCSVLVTAATFKSSDYLAMLREIGPERLPDLKVTIALGSTPGEGVLPWAELARPADDARLAAIEADLRPDDPINIQFTSGTTGRPKGATLTHRNILNNGHFASRQLRLRADDRICIPVPLYHCFGMVLGNLAALASGAAMVYPGDAYEPRATLEAVEAERCTALYGVPTMLIAILNHPDLARFDVSSLRTGIMAGALCPRVMMEQVIDRLNMREVTIGYGMTETSPLTTQTAIDDPIEVKVSTVGRVHPHAEAKIVGPDGAVVPRGQQGEYCARGYAVMQGYWGDPEKTAEAVDNEGWMHSGDLATMDEDGCIRITGRIKDMIIRGGENVYPREVEDFLLTHPAIADAQVFGVADPVYGEAVCAWVIPVHGARLTEEEVLAHCRGRIAHYKVPRHVRVVESFVMTVTGKAQKFAMRRIMEEDLGGAARGG